MPRTVKREKRPPEKLGLFLMRSSITLPRIDR